MKTRLLCTGVYYTDKEEEFLTFIALTPEQEHAGTEPSLDQRSYAWSAKALRKANFHGRELSVADRQVLHELLQRYPRNAVARKIIQLRKQYKAAQDALAQHTSSKRGPK
jgi:hypothetical protein